MGVAAEKGMKYRRRLLRSIQKAMARCHVLRITHLSKRAVKEPANHADHANEEGFIGVIRVIRRLH